MAGTHIFKLLLEQRNHVLLDDNALLVEVLDDEVVVFTVNVDNDGLDGGVALDEHAWQGRAFSQRSLNLMRVAGVAYF